MDTQNLQKNFECYANFLQVQPNIIGTEGSTNGAVWYVGATPNTPTPGYGSTLSVTASNIVNTNPLANLSDLIIQATGPAYDAEEGYGVPQITISMGSLYSAIGQILNNYYINVNQNINVQCQVVDVVSNGTVGQMIILGSDVIPIYDNLEDVPV